MSGQGPASAGGVEKGLLGCFVLGNGRLHVVVEDSMKPGVYGARPVRRVGRQGGSGAFWLPGLSRGARIRLWLPVASALLLGACATSRQAAPAGAAQDASRRGIEFSKAAVSPLNDLNVMQDEIPAALVAARLKPYAPPASPRCAAVLAEVRNLDLVLGADVDAPRVADGAGLAERGADAVGDAAVDAFRSAVENLVPFRGWIRRLSGAAERDREVAASIAAAMARRAFLKGFAAARACGSPASARPTANPH